MKEKEIINPTSGLHDDLSLYVHIPFCDVICPYCDFNKYSKADNLIDGFIKSLIKEINIRKIENKKVASISFGGGTPSYIPNNDLKKIFKNIQDNFDINNKDIEISIEVNPKDVDGDKIKFYEDLGINRISVGGQSFDNAVLKTLGRNHNSKELIKSLEVIKKSSITNINLDLIYGVPNQKLHSWENSLKRFIDYSFPHLSAYQLTFEPKTKFYRDLMVNKIKEIDENITVEMFLSLNSILKKNNYTNYEISNWSKPRKESIHNLRYWNKKNYLGLGPGASSFLNNKRTTNVRSLKKYINNLHKSKLEFDENYILDKRDILIENIMLNLRLSGGIDHREFKNNFSFNFNDFFSELINYLVKYNLIKSDNSSTVLTERGKLISDSIFVLFEEKIQSNSF